MPGGTEQPHAGRELRVSAATDDIARGAVRLMLGWQVALLLVSSAAVLASGRGDGPAGRTGLTVVVAVVAVALLLARRPLATALLRRPRLMLACAAGFGAVCLVDGVHAPSAFALVGLPLLGLAAVAGTATLALGCTAFMVAGAVGGPLLPGGLAASEWHAADTVANLSALVAVTVALVLLFGALRATLLDGQAIVIEARPGGWATTPALQARLPAPRPAGALPRADPEALLERLTATERRVVGRLAAGRAPKQIAADWGLSVATIRAHIRAAKRKTGARTLNELAALAGDGSDAPTPR
jgi:DNA-binding CsgD family transcriptional regulator